MKLFLIVLCVILLKVSVGAQLIIALANGERVKFGPLDVRVKVGQLPPKYPVLSNVDLTASRNLVNYLEQMRKSFATGTSEMPPLDPFLKTEIEPFDVETDLILGRVALRNVEVSGLSKYILHSLETRMNGYRIDFNISLPALEVDVDYIAATTLSGVLPLSFTGHVYGQLVNMNLYGATRIEAVRYLSNTVFQVRALDVHATADDVEGQVTGLNLGEAAEILDKDNLGAKNPLIQVVKKKVADSVAKVVTQEINEFLLNFSASKILKYFYTGKLTQLMRNYQSQ